MESVIDQCSLFSVYLEVTGINHCTRNELTLSKATGSLYEHNGQSFLVTNWHVLSGRNSESGKPLDEINSALPEKVKVHFPIDGAIGRTIEESYNLKAENEKYTWLQHSRGGAIDVALLPIDLPKGISTLPVNSINESRRLNEFPPNLHVGQEVFILGFPLGIRDGGNLPIWKKASIATEPMIPVGDNEYKMLVDTATREGMSGSPVLIVGTPDAHIQPDHTFQTVAFRPYKIFVGIYSGRICGKDELAAQLGIVWKATAIREIIDSKLLYCDHISSGQEASG